MLVTPQPEAVKAVYAAIRSTCKHELIQLSDREPYLPTQRLIGYAVDPSDPRDRHWAYPEIEFTDADVQTYFESGAYYDSWPYADHNGNPVYETVYVKHDIEWLDRQPEATLLDFADALCGYTPPKK